MNLMNPDDLLERLNDELDLLMGIVGGLAEEAKGELTRLLETSLEQKDIVEGLKELGKNIRFYSDMSKRPKENLTAGASMLDDEGLVELGLASLIDKAALIEQLERAFRSDVGGLVGGRVS